MGRCLCQRRIYIRLVVFILSLLFPSLLAMIPSTTFDFSWPAQLSNSGSRSQHSLDDLPDDVLLDGVLHVLTVQEILTVRVLNKRFFILTHHPSIWKRLLRRLNPPLPPLPPTLRRSFANITGFEAERLFVRSLSLSKNLSSQNPTPYWARSIEAFHHVQSMVILPGGHHLVASVKEETSNSFSLMIFVLDYRDSGGLPLAKADTATQAYNLQAKYMTYHGESGIMIACTLKDIRSKKYKMATQRFDISSLNPSATIDAPVPLKYECLAFFCPLTALEELGDPDLYLPGSNEFLERARSQAAPFKLIAELSSASSLGPINLAEMFGSPCMVVVKGNRRILFKNLELPGHSLINCPPISFPTEVPENTAIKAIRLLPSEATVLVVQKDKIQGVVLEVFPIPIIGTVSNEQFPISAITLSRTDIESINITDNPPLFSTYADLDLNPESPPNLIAQSSRTISVVCLTAEDPITKKRTFCRISLPSRPWEESDRPLPLVPFPLPEGVLVAHGGREAFLRKHATHYCCLVPTRDLFPIGFAATDGKMNCLPGSNHSLVYWNVDSIRESSPLRAFAIYSAPPPAMREDGDDPEVEEVEAIVNGVPMRRKNLRIKLVHIWEELWDTIAPAPARCLAWDECIGRMCVVLENDSRIFLVDFSQTPKEGDHGERLPIPVRSYQNPTQSGFFGKLLKSLRL